MLTALNYCTADFPRQGELRLQLQKMQSCSIFLTILHQAMQRKMSTKPHFWTYLSQIPFLYLSQIVILYLSKIPLLYLSKIPFCICHKYLLQHQPLSGIKQLVLMTILWNHLKSYDSKNICSSGLIYPCWAFPEFSGSRQIVLCYVDKI